MSYGETLTSSSGLLVEGRTLLSLFILPPPVLVTLAAGVLDNGYDRPLMLRTSDSKEEREGKKKINMNRISDWDCQGQP